MEPVFHFPEPTDGVQKLQIDSNLLQEIPLSAESLYYKQKATTVNSLTILGISEEDTKAALSMFPDLKHLKLIGISLTDDEWTGYPTALETFQFIECRVSEKVVESWLKAIATTLQGIHVRRSKYKITMGGGSICDLVRLQSVPLLRNVSLDNYKYCYFGEIRETLEYFCCFDLRDHLSSLVQHSKHTLKTLIIQNSPEHKKDMQLFWEMKQLRHLRIINPVDEDVLFQLQSMRRLMSLDVHCYLPPKKQNKILHILNDDCLIKIFSYLKLKDWVALTRTNSRFNKVVCQYVYPRQVIRLNEIDLKESERSGVLQQIGAYCKFSHLGAREIHLLKHFTKLEVLNVEHRKFHETEQKSIPNGLRKLSLEFDEW